MQHSPGFLAITRDARQRIQECTVDDVRGWRAAGRVFHLIDVREDNEYAAGGIAGAVHLSKGIIERDIEQAIPDHNAMIVVYCGGGYRSAMVADNLQKMGYTNVLSMDGGIKAWRDAE